MQLTSDQLIAACGDEAFDSGLRIESRMEPIAGRGAPVKPAIYAGNRYQADVRWYDEWDVAQPVIVIDNGPSQANRLEAALEEVAERAGLPRVILDLSAAGNLPPHLPRTITGYRFPHRNADAYLRDAELNGERLLRTDIGRSIFSATADDPDALFRWFPQALLYGYWQSHLGARRSQAKLARSWVSEIVGIRPATSVDGRTRTLGIKGDPLNLSTDEKVVYEEDDPSTWTLSDQKKSGGSKKKESLAELGHGQVPFRTNEEAMAAVSFDRILQRSTVSVAALRRVHSTTPDASAAGRATLVAIGIVAHVFAFSRPFSLRSGCELRTTDATWTWLGDGTPGSDEAVEVPGAEEALELLATCAGRAHAVGVPVAEGWGGRLDLQPNPELIKVIRDTYPTEA